MPLLSFGPTQTEPKNSKFYGPDPGPTRLYSVRTGLDRTETIYHQPEVKKFQTTINVNTPCNKVITSYNVVIRGNNHSTCQFGYERHVFHEGVSLSLNSREKSLIPR